MVACNNKKKGGDDKKPADTSATTNNGNTGDNTTVSTPEGVPTFADAEVQAYANDYAAFVDSYVDAYKTKDMSKIQSLSAKMTDWSTRSIEVSKRFANNPGDAKKFADWATVQAQRLTDAAKAMMP